MSRRVLSSIEKEKLINKYPFLKCSEDNDIILLDCLPIGWVIRFGEQMCAELLEILQHHNYVEEYEVYQVKEKFNELRWYDNADYAWEDYKKWLHKYEELSYHTCVKCGQPATVITNGWATSYCDDCVGDLKVNYHDIDFTNLTEVE